MTKTIELWLSRYPVVTCNENTVYLWEAGSTNLKHYSILDYVEQHADFLRNKYLAFIYDLGECRLSCKKIVEHLQLSSGYNLWWMSLLANKNRLNTPGITDCIKLLAFEQILKEKKPKTVIIYGQDKELVTCIKKLCIGLEVFVTYEPISKVNKSVGLWPWLRKKRPELFSALFWLFRYTFTHWSLTKVKPINWHYGEEAVILFSKFFNFDEKNTKKNRFQSHYWEALPEFLRHHNLKINWLHLFRKSSMVSDANTGVFFIESFSRNDETLDKHSFFESFLSFKVLFSAFSKYIKIYIDSLLWRKVERAFQPIDSAINFWPLLNKDWFSSTRGATALSNLIFIELADAALKSMPKQKLGLYIQENHFWEKALLHGWRLYGHGKLIGVPPSTVNYWDLIYYDDFRVITATDSYAMEKPDLVALNGPIAKENFLANGYPIDQIFEVEALRYLYLLRSSDKLKSKSDLTGFVRDRNETDKNVIILGDYDKSTTIEMLQAIHLATKNIHNLRLTFKSHPACQVDGNDINIPELQKSDRQLSELLCDFDLVITTGSTSAAAEAYLSRINVIIWLNKNELNLSPIRGISDVHFVRTSGDLSEALASIDKMATPANVNDLFWLDNKLSRWANLFLESGYTQFEKDSKLIH